MTCLKNNYNFDDESRNMILVEKLKWLSNYLVKRINVLLRNFSLLPINVVCFFPVGALFFFGLLKS